tara:strand:+ start:412 stop:948 length:537 start_codon:yes stop_codon:yes gene_type:complete
MNLVKLISTDFDKFKRRVVKFLRFGLKDVQTSIEASPFGIDSNPIPEMVAIYGKTSGDGNTFIMGYLVKDKLADVGETRLFSTDDKGVLQTYLWLRNDGTMEVGGDADNMVRYSELETAFNELKTDHNNLVTEWNAFAAVYLPGGPANVGLPATLAGATEPPSGADITPAKIDEIKTI